MDAHAWSPTSQQTAEPPPSLFAWIPLLWNRALFPGKSLSNESSQIKPLSLTLLILLPGVLLYPCLFFALFEPDETRYAQIPREMLHSGSWIVPTLQGEPYLDKPPLFYWSVAGSYQLFGESAASARLIPALMVHGCILLVYLFGRRWIGEQAALWSALLLMLAPGFLTMGRLLLLDGMLTFWTTFTIFSAYEALRGSTLHRGWWILSAFCCGLGVLTKGPVTVILLLPPLLLHGWLMKDQPVESRLARPHRRDILTYLLIVLAIPAPWFLAMLIQSPEFARHFLWEHNIMRFVSPFDHQRGVWFYIPVFILGLLPATIWLWPFCRFLVSGDQEQAQQRSSELSFLLLTGGWCLLFFTVSGCKLPTYILPAFPPLALAFGLFLTRTGRTLTRKTKVILGSTFVLMMMVNHMLMPWYAGYRSPTRNAEALIKYCGDPKTSVVCYPRPCNAAAFLLNRSDLCNYRSKDIEQLRTLVRQQPQTVILCTHRHSLDGLKQLLPPEVVVKETMHFGLDDVPGLPESWQPTLKKLLGETALGLCDLAVIELRPEWRKWLTMKHSAKR